MAVQALEEAKESLLGQDRMKILLDECLPVDFRHSFPGYETTAHPAIWTASGLPGRPKGTIVDEAPPCSHPSIALFGD